MSAWLPWLVAAAILLVVPVVLGLFVTDEPDNAIRHESSDDHQEDARDPAPGLRLAA